MACPCSAVERRPIPYHAERERTLAVRDVTHKWYAGPGGGARWGEGWGKVFDVRQGDTTIPFMGRERRPPRDFIADIVAEDDGIVPIREVGEWTQNKLGILQSYLGPFAKACTSAGRWYFVDTMAGSGLCRIRESGQILRGSTLIALNVDPPFAGVLSLELERASAEALARRTAPFGERARVVNADANQRLAAELAAFIPRDKPVLILMDPEGTELDWATVSAAARHRVGKKKVELLILFMTTGVPRMLPVERDIELHNEMRLNRLFPPEADWRRVWEERRDGLIEPGEARQRYVAEYSKGLEGLGYKHVLNREVRQQNGALVYHLLFATDDDTGKRIMEDVFEHMYPTRLQPPLL